MEKGTRVRPSVECLTVDYLNDGPRVLSQTALSVDCLHDNGHIQNRLFVC